MDAAAAHVLVFPWPRQGHINPMLHLAAALLDAGLRVTFLHTDHSLRRLAHVPPPAPPRPMRVLSLPDGLVDDHPRGFLALMASMCATSRPAYRALLSSLLSSGAPVTCVVADGTMPFAVQVAEELGVPALAFAAHSACSYLALLCTPQLDELGETAFRADDPVRGVPGVEGFRRRRDLPRGLRCAEQGDSDPMVLKVAEAIARSCKAARALVLNTAVSMEQPALVHITSRAATDVFAVGPLHRQAVEVRRKRRGRESMAGGGGVHGVAGRPGGGVRRVREPGEPRGDHARAVHRVPRRPRGHRARLPLGAPAGPGPDGQPWAARSSSSVVVACFLTPGGTQTLECADEGVLALLRRPADQQPPRGAPSSPTSRPAASSWGTGLDMKDVCDSGVVESTVREAMAHGKIRAAARAMAQQLRLDVAKAGSSSSEQERLVGFIRELSPKPRNRINED